MNGTPVVGERYRSFDCIVTVESVGPKNARVSVVQTSTNARWNKSQPYPFPAEFEKIEEA